MDMDTRFTTPEHERSRLLCDALRAYGVFDGLPTAGPSSPDWLGSFFVVAWLEAYRSKHWLLMLHYLNDAERILIDRQFAARGQLPGSPPPPADVAPSLNMGESVG